MAKRKFKIMVLYGGPDKEREVSIQSGKQIAKALSASGHEVILRDITPNAANGTVGLAPLDEFYKKNCDIAFPALHGKWGEGGGLQAILEQRGIPFVGTGAKEATLCMDKSASKVCFQENNLPTPDFEIFELGKPINLIPPAVVKPADEGSSIALNICTSQLEINQACQRLSGSYSKILIEKYIAGRELTVGIIERNGSAVAGGKPLALPVIEIVPDAKFYDYDAKYKSADTKYNFDIDLPKTVLDEVSKLALKAHKILGASQLSRVDFMVDNDNKPWVLELNTMPGFTSHSLLPMAAKQAGIDLPELVDGFIKSRA